MSTTSPSADETLNKCKFNSYWTDEIQRFHAFVHDAEELA